MKTCYNCYWRDHCAKDEGFENKRCEDYDPIFGGESIVAREYEEALEERIDAYQEIVREQQGITED